MINTSFDIFGGGDVSYAIWSDTSGFTLELSPACTPQGTSFGCPGLLKTSLEGDSLWTRTFEGGNIVDFLRDEEGYYYACGQEYVDASTLYRPFLRKLGAEGDSIWIRYYDGPLKDSAIDIEQSPDGHLIVYILGGVFGQYSIITVQKLDREDGAVIWEEEVDTGLQFPSSGELTVLTDGSIMLGYRYPVPGTTFDYGYAVTRLSPQGETLWTRTFSEGNTSEYPALIEALPDGGVAVAWGKDSISVWPNEPFLAINFFLQRLDENGQTEWEFFYRVGDREVYGMTVTGNGDIVLCGLTYILDNGGEGPNGTNYSWLARFSPQGELRWERSYLSPTTPEPMWGFQDVTEAPDGGLAMCGFITDTVPGVPGGINDNVWLAKVGPDGCLTPGCQDSILYLTYTQEPGGGPARVEEVFFRAFPNPASGPVQVAFYNPVRRAAARLRVLDLQGRVLWEAPLQRGTRQVEVPTAGWPGGLYLLQYEAGGRVLQVGKVVFGG